MGFLKLLRQKQGLSERTLAEAAGIARETLRGAEADFTQTKPSQLAAIAENLNQQVMVLVAPDGPALSDFSTISVSLAVVADGFESWKIHFMDLVDQFRRQPDIRLLILPPSQKLDPRLQALLASMVVTLCDEVGLAAPDWAKVEQFLPRPWFVSGIESLKASALLESPLAFRRNNIFVQDNFMKRV